MPSDLCFVSLPLCRPRRLRREVVEDPGDPVHGLDAGHHLHHNLQRNFKTSRKFKEIQGQLKINLYRFRNVFSRHRGHSRHEVHGLEGADDDGALEGGAAVDHAAVEVDGDHHLGLKSI